MVRSMYSGVAGMKANQGRMDVIGNNISNANTYGFKSGRATFRDMYYQQVRGASAGTQTRGSINPSMVGYGAQLSSIDLMMDSSSMTSTGFALDCAITGEGFFQVMDPDGNIYYTKAGMLDIDQATGALIDSNGNFVLGTSATDGKLNSAQPGSNKILITVNSVQAATAKLVKEISGKTLTIESSNMTKEANVSFAFTKGADMPDGMRVRAVMDSTTSVINIQLNPNAEFESMEDLAEEVNNAIVQAYGGKHPGGNFSFSMEPDPFVTTNADGTTGPLKLTGAQIINSSSADYEGANIEVNVGTTGIDKNGKFLGGFKFVEAGLTFTGSGKTDFKIEADVDATSGKVLGYKVTASVGGTPDTYTGYITRERAEASNGGNTVLLQKVDAKGDPIGDSNDTLTFSYPSATKIDNAIRTAAKIDADKPLTNGVSATQTALGNATPGEPTHNLGWGQSTFTLEGGTEFRTQGVNNLTGISVGADGTITGTSDAGLQILGRIDLATFGNAKGLMQTGNTYFSATASSGTAKLAIPGEEGTGAIKNNALEMSNVDLAQEFSDMIVTQRGFQASSRMITVSDTMLEELINLKR